MQTMIAYYAGTYAVCRQVALSQLHTWRERGCPYECDCAYAEGQLDAHYPVPATIRVSWKLSLDYRPVVITKHGNIEYAVTSWI